MECFNDGITKKKDENENEIMKESVQLSDEDHFENELTLKCIELGEKLSLLLKDNVHQLYLENHKVKQIETLNSYQSSEWLLQRLQALILLLCNLCKIDINTAGPSKLNVLPKTIELIYYDRNCKLVLPNHLIESLLRYSFTNSKSYVDFLGNRAPSRSYTYLISWLKQQASNPLKFPIGLCKAVSDIENK